MVDTFNGDNAALIRSAEALLRLDAAGALAPHGIGGHARDIITAFIARLDAAGQRQPVGDIVQRLRDTPNWRKETYGSWKDCVSTYDRAPFEAADEIERLSALLATQPPQDERGQVYAKCWVCDKPMDGKSEDDCHCFHRKELAAQPVALSTLTDEEIIKAANIGAVYTERVGRVERHPEQYRRELQHSFLRGARWVLAASAPAQQATAPQPVAAEVVKGAALAVIEAWDRTPEHFDVDVKWLKPMNKAMVSLRAALSGTGSDESKKGDNNG